MNPTLADWSEALAAYLAAHWLSLAFGVAAGWFVVLAFRFVRSVRRSEQSFSWPPKGAPPFSPQCACPNCRAHRRWFGTEETKEKR